MKEVKIKDQMLQKAAAEGMDEFVKVFVDAISEAVNGSLNSDNMAELNADQITLTKSPCWPIIICTKK